MLSSYFPGVSSKPEALREFLPDRVRALLLSHSLRGYQDSPPEDLITAVPPQPEEPSVARLIAEIVA